MTALATPPRRGKDIQPRARKNAQRDARIVDAFHTLTRRGMKRWAAYRRIAEQFGISDERVRQIVVGEVES